MKKIKENIHKRDSNVCMHENYGDNHIYLIGGHSHLELGYKSVTTFITDFFSKFDADTIIDKYWDNWQEKQHPKYYQIEKEEIKKMWEKNSTDLCNAGTDMHELFEYYINERRSKENTIELKNFKNWCWYEVYEPIRTEYTVYGEDEKIVGNIDMIYKNKNRELCIVDYKRSEVPTSNAYGKKCVGINLPDTNKSKHTMQLNIYKYLLEKYYNMKISHIYNLYIKECDCNFVEQEIINIDEIMGNRNLYKA